MVIEMNKNILKPKHILKLIKLKENKSNQQIL